MPSETIRWLTVGKLEEGEKTAVYPYTKLRNIRGLDDCRRAVADEVGPIEAEFGQDLVQPFYDLLWELNTEPGIFTSHCGASGSTFRPMKDVECGVGTHLITLSRERARQDSLEAHNQLINYLGWHVTSNPLASSIDPARSWSELSPVYVKYYCEVVSASDGLMREVTSARRGYGCQILVTGAGSTRLEAAQQWSAACAVIATVFKEVKLKRGWSSIPFDHSLHFRLIE